MRFSGDAIIFDLGGVVVNLSIERTVTSFQKKIPDFTDAQFVGKPDQHPIFNRYETGVTNTQTFYHEFLKHYQVGENDLPFSSFKDSWNEMILDLPPARVDLIHRLRTECKKVYLLSNINALHAEDMERVFESLDLPGTFRQNFDRAYYSYEMALRKPDPKIFERVLSENALKPETTLFIDDSLQHVESAKRLGFQTIHLLKPQTIDTLSL